MTSRQDEYEGMIRRVELAKKAISNLTNGRSRLAGVARGLEAVLDEAYERMDLAWRVLSETGDPLDFTFRAQKAAEMSLCCVMVCKVYDELCALYVIGKDEQSEPTISQMIKEADAEERRNRRSEKKVRTSYLDEDGNRVRVRIPASEYKGVK
jgi:hypothetical protein